MSMLYLLSKNVSHSLCEGHIMFKICFYFYLNAFFLLISFDKNVACSNLLIIYLFSL